MVETLVVYEGLAIVEVFRLKYADTVDRAVKLTELNDLLVRRGRHVISMGDNSMQADFNALKERYANDVAKPDPAKQ